MDTGVAAQVEEAEGRRGERAGGRRHQVGGAGERQDRPVVVPVAMQVEKGRPGGGGQRAENRVVAALADVDHALEQHGASVARGRGPTGSRPAGPPGEDLLGDDGV